MSMTKADRDAADAALTRAQKLFGACARVRFDQDALSRAGRRAAHEQLLSHRVDMPPRDSARWAQWKAKADELTGKVLRVRCTVGEDSAIAFHVRGWGDTWEEAFEDAGKS